MAEHVTLSIDTERFNARLRAFLAQSTQAAERIVFETAAQVLSDTQQGWPVDTGASRAAWWGPRKAGPLAYQIGNPLVYAAIIEFGGYPHPGEKTAPFGPVVLPGDFSINQGVYPRQQPAAPLRRALSKNYGRITDELKTLFGREWGH